VNLTLLDGTSLRHAAVADVLAGMMMAQVRVFARRRGWGRQGPGHAVAFAVVAAMGALAGGMCPGAGRDPVHRHATWPAVIL